MKRLLLSLIITFLTSSICLSQTINFTDLELKEYLINEACVDTTDNGIFFSYDIDVDLNNDNEIQVIEAQNVLKLEINDLADNYSITSLLDLNHFQNLNYLSVLHNDNLSEVSNLNIDSLESLIIGTCISLNTVDVSSLSNLSQVLRIEDIDTLDYLNIQNGSVAQFFSMFYSDHIHYACIDSIAAEYDEVSWKMITGTPSLDDCIPLSIENIQFGNESISLFPNPSNGTLEIRSSLVFDDISIYNIRGILIEKLRSSKNKMDISHLKSGVYFFRFKSDNELRFKKVLKL